MVQNWSFSPTHCFHVSPGICRRFWPEVLTQTPQNAVFRPRSYSKGPNHALEKVLTKETPCTSTRSPLCSSSSIKFSSNGCSQSGNGSPITGFELDISTSATLSGTSLTHNSGTTFRSWVSIGLTGVADAIPARENADPYFDHCSFAGVPP